MNEEDMIKESVAKKIAGDIVLAEDAGKTIQKWRNIFKIPQRRLSDEIKIMPSVISDYENGRRKSPGIKVIKKIVEALIRIDEKNGGKIIKEFSLFPSKNIVNKTMIDMKEFSGPISIEKFCKNIDSKIVARKDLSDSNIYGYTVIDALKAIVELPPTEIVKLYGVTNERAMIFTGAHKGRSVMVALKVTNLKPKLVILHGVDSIDELAKRIAEIEGITLAISNTKSLDKLLKDLKNSFHK